VIGVAVPDSRCGTFLACDARVSRLFIAWLAFFFNSAVLAFTINIAARLI